MTLLNNSIPYTARVSLTKKGFSDITFDFFVGGFPIAPTIELGTYVFFQSDQKQHNVSGRIFDAMSNQTLAVDYSLTIYQGYGTLNKSNVLPYANFYFPPPPSEDLETGYFDLENITAGVYTAVADSLGYNLNFQRFYALPSPPYTSTIRPIPMVPWLYNGELTLVLTWGASP
eukprot:CAMPEP_0202978818 /NCGR_PEP_ID=MMETSP1396-20130829/85135_1 /ASSEMBLY_ACC=CAM_ASM_000872 /TAXON_ID= /ORGANISM="Pseudokeronopsis sp., Strain Brazil" /LENGTH=172 /DNA_ID=CAMNT_0049717957 /DNA_START=261 /DNA_END=779 /DNA_ORIENTATION=-